MKRWLRDQAFRGLLKNAGYLATSRGVAGILSVGALAFTTHGLGTTLFGILILIHSYAQATSGIAKFQSWQVVIRYGAPALRTRESATLHHGVSFAIGLDVVSGLVGMVVAMAMLPLVAPLFHISADLLPIALLYCTLLPTMAAGTPTGVLRLLDRFDLISWQGTVTPAVRLLLTGAGWLFHWPFEAFLLIWYVTDLLGDLVLWVLALRELKRRDLLHGLRFGLRRHARQLAGAWRFALTTNLTTSLAAAWGPMANLLVGALLGPVAAGQYRIASGLVEAANKPADMLSKAFYPEVMRMDLATRKPWKLMLRGAALSTAIGLVFVLLVLIGGRPFVGAVFGSGFEPAAGLLMLMVFGMLVTMVGFPLGPMLYAMERPGVPLRARTVATILYLITIVPFSRLMGLNGAGLAYVLCMLLIVLQMIPPLYGEFHRRTRTAQHAG